MNLKNILFISLTLVLLFVAISSVNAIDNNSTDIKDIVPIPTENSLTATCESLKLSSSLDSFSALNNRINSNNESDIYLHNSYYFYSDEDSSFVNGIVIDREVTIHGNGFTLNGANSARIFQINNKNVILKDIKFINGKTPGQTSGGAVSGDCSAISCTFIHNSANQNGGAMYKGTAINCTFKDNYANYDVDTYSSGGAMHDGTAINCIFESNTAEINGGALSFSTAINSTFISNNAKWNGGAMYKSRAINCTFKDNYAKKDGGAIEMGSAENCDFINNFAELSGGATKDTNATNCNFNNNKATHDGGAMYYGRAVNCNFADNTAERGGATFYTTAVLCNFTGNSATIYGNAMYKGLAVQCNFNKKDLYETIIDDFPIFTALNFTSTYNSGEKLLFHLKSNDEELADIETAIKIYKNDNLIEEIYALTGNGWTVDLMPGLYNAVLSIDELVGINPVKVLLSISQSPTVISAPSLITHYKKDDYLIITLKDNYGKAIANTYVNVDLGKVVQYETDENGQIRIATNNFDPNTYNVDVSFDGNDNYIKSNATTKLTVTKSQTSLELQQINSSDNVNYDLIVTLRDGDGNYLTGEILSVDLLGIRNYTTDENGQIVFYSKDLPAGAFPINIKFNENKYYTKSNVSTTFNVVLIPTVISCDEFTTYYKSNEKFKATLTDYQGNPLVNCPVTVELDGIKNYITDENGQIEISTASLIPRTYVANITFNGNEKYANSKNTTNVNVEKCPVEIDIHQVSTHYNIKDDLVITLKDYYGDIIKHAQLSIHFNMTKNYTTDENGQVTIPTEGYAPDSYRIIATFKGNELYQENEKILYIYIFKEYAIISVSNTIFEYNPNGYFLINITDSLNRPIPNLKLNIDFNGIENYISDENGQVKISIEGFTPGSYPLIVDFKGNNYYYKTTRSDDIIINKAVTSISAPAVVATIDEIKDLVIDIKDSYSQPICDLELYVDLKGAEKYYIIDENGQAKISTKGLMANTYPVNIAFNGNENYTPSNTTTKIIINKKTTPITADINVVENDVTILVNVDMNAKGYIIFDITGVKNYTFFSPITDGQAKLFATLSDGEYDINIVYDENDYYYGNSTSESFVVGKAKGNIFGGSNSEANVNTSGGSNSEANVNTSGESDTGENSFKNLLDSVHINESLFTRNLINNQFSGEVEKNTNEINQSEKFDTRHRTISVSTNLPKAFNQLLIFILIICALGIIIFAVKRKS